MTNKVYQFQMSAVGYIGGEPVEGDLSEVTAQSIVFVPKPGKWMYVNPLLFWEGGEGAANGFV